MAKFLSFSEASNRLFISQSAVSQSIRQLEEKLNCRLFNRSTKQVKLTPEGKILFQHIEQAYNFIKTGERSISEIYSLKQGEIRIGASDTICKYYLLPYLKKFRQTYPNIKISITNRTSPVCIDLLQKGLVDISVINLPLGGGQQPQQLTMTPIKKIQDVFVAGSHFGSLLGKQLNLRDLQQYPLLILEPHTVTRDFFAALIKEHNVDLKPEIELGSLELTIELAKIGLGISFVIREYIEKELAAGELFALNLKETIPARYLGLVRHNSIPLPVAAEKFVELLL